VTFASSPAETSNFLEQGVTVFIGQMIQQKVQNKGGKPKGTTQVKKEQSNKETLCMATSYCSHIYN